MKKEYKKPLSTIFVVRSTLPMMDSGSNPTITTPSGNMEAPNRDMEWE